MKLILIEFIEDLKLYIKSVILDYIRYELSQELHSEKCIVLTSEDHLARALEQVLHLKFPLFYHLNVIESLSIFSYQY